MITPEQLASWCQSAGIESYAVMRVPEALDASGLEQLLADGIGDMHYLAEHRELRLQPERIHPGSELVLIALLGYPAPPAQAESTALKRARYASGKDYHKVLRGKLAGIAREITAAEPGSSCRATVDSAPVNERTLAQLAGIGWIGRNALLLHPRRGSYHFIGCLFSTAPLPLTSPALAEDRCGSCTACETRCPTAALLDRRVLSTRCISYLTIEHQGVIPRDLAQHFEGWWFGCDLCQEVCPWNRFAPGAEDQRLSGSDDERDLLALQAADFDAYFAGRAVRRIGYERFRRNLLVALWSVGRIDELAALRAEGLPLVLAQAAELGC